VAAGLLERDGIFSTGGAIGVDEDALSLRRGAFRHRERARQDSREDEGSSEY
jgi:hypothetical protein